jgi:hypothetical protein
MSAGALGRKYLMFLGSDRIDECMALFSDDVLLVLPATMQKGARFEKDEFRTMLSRVMSLFDVGSRYAVTGSDFFAHPCRHEGASLFGAGPRLWGVES